MHSYPKLTSENHCCITENFYYATPKEQSLKSPYKPLQSNNYYKDLYGDLSNGYLGVKNSNKYTSEFLTLSPFVS